MRLLLAIALAACAPRPGVVEPVATSMPVHCFTAVARFAGRAQVAVGCFETEALCGNAQRRAVKWGGMAGVIAVSACGRRGE